jgi:hypothetical protein
MYLYVDFIAIWPFAGPYKALHRSPAFSDVRLLIEHNTSIDLATEDGKTALHLAWDKGHLNIQGCSSSTMHPST